MIPALLVLGSGPDFLKLRLCHPSEPNLELAKQIPFIQESDPVPVAQVQLATCF